MRGEYGFSDNPNVSKGSPLLGALKVFAAAAVLVGTLYFSIGIAVDAVVPLLPDSTVQSISKRMDWIRIPSGGKMTPVEQSIQRLADRLAEADPDAPRIRVRVVPSDMVNAFALPDGTVLLNTGLLARLESENGLAFILGHEMAHIRNRDALRGLGRAMAYQMVAEAVGFGSEQVFSDPAQLSELAFSRGQEERADREGMDTVQKLYGHVGGYDEFFRIMQRERAQEAWAAYFSTHPHDDRRIQLMQEHSDDMGYVMGSETPLILPRDGDESL